VTKSEFDDVQISTVIELSDIRRIAWSFPIECQTFVAKQFCQWQTTKTKVQTFSL